MYKQIPGFENYEISADGDVIGKRFRKSLKPKICNGYETVGLYTANGYKWRNVHRLCAIAWIGLPENHDALHVAHNDGNRRNNHYSNLRWATPLENSHDRYRHGTARGANPGEAHHNSKLTASRVAEMRDRVRAGEMLTEVARSLNVKKLTAYDAVTGKTWKSINKISMPVSIKGAKNYKAGR